MLRNIYKLRDGDEHSVMGARYESTLLQALVLWVPVAVAYICFLLNRDAHVWALLSSSLKSPHRACICNRMQQALDVLLTLYAAACPT